MPPPKVQVADSAQLNGLTPRAGTGGFFDFLERGFNVYAQGANAGVFGGSAQRRVRGAPEAPPPSSTAAPPPPIPETGNVFDNLLRLVPLRQRAEAAGAIERQYAADVQARLSGSIERNRRALSAVALAIGGVAIFITLRKLR